MPVILVHGSPGSAGDFDKLAPKLADAGYTVIVPDLLGYGVGRGVWSEAPASRSIEWYGHAIVALMDELKIPRAHLVGWSNGGGVVMHAADLAPQRVASLTLMASIGLQEYEWSGSHAFEHGKYAVGYGVVGWLPELLPHFGLLGTRETRTAWLDFFADSDQRPLRALMARLGERGVPTLILHGKHDILVPDYAAEEHHALIASSRLVMLEANHFIPFVQADEAVGVLLPYFARHDDPAASARTDEEYRIERDDLTWLDLRLALVRRQIDTAPVGVTIGVVAALAIMSPGVCVMAGALAIARCSMDPIVVLAGMLLGVAVQTAFLYGLARVRGKSLAKLPIAGTELPRPSAVDWQNRLNRWPYFEGFRSLFAREWRVAGPMGAGAAVRAGGVAWHGAARFMLGRGVGALAWSLVALIVCVALEALVLKRVREMAPGLIHVPITIGVLYIAALAGPMVLTRRSRQHALAQVGRVIHHEYWPTWAFYAPFWPFFVGQATKHRGFRHVTCCNPEIENGGGWADESKVGIIRRLMAANEAGGPGHVLPTFLLSRDGSPTERAQRVRELMAREATVASFPIVLKPDRGQRGHGFKVVRRDQDLEPYFAEMLGDAVVQAYHAGPEECGVLWLRHARGEGPSDGSLGFIYSITRKEFPFIEGDGAHTLEELIRRHRRYRRQAGVFLARFADDASRVPAKGERIRLSISGNHAQGTLFRDGADLITPELSREIDRIARAFPRLDVGRFDIRYESDERLKRGEGIGIVELNGTSAEPTNMYDPDRSIFFAYRVLFGMWRRVFVLGKEREREGVRALEIPEFLRIVRKHFAEQTGSSVAD